MLLVLYRSCLHCPVSTDVVNTTEANSTVFLKQRMNSFDNYNKTGYRWVHPDTADNFTKPMIHCSSDTSLQWHSITLNDPTGAWLPRVSSYFLSGPFPHSAGVGADETAGWWNGTDSQFVVKSVFSCRWQVRNGSDGNDSDHGGDEPEEYVVEFSYYLVPEVGTHT